MKFILPSILSADFANLGAQVKELEDNGIEIVHIDIMDGHFVPNISFGFPVMKSLRPITKMTFDVHLMIENPANYIEEFVKSGADMITVHLEGNNHIHRLIQNIKSYNVKAGIAINPGTPVASLKHLLSDLDLVLVMGVNPGFGGQSLIPFTIDKVRELDAIRKAENLNFKISVDGGIKSTNYKEMLEAGADMLVAGSDIFKNNAIQDNINSFK
ncbi:MAG: ribulose-phosphate 3-epimerase [Clostridium sp.]|nr:ribulose-phosphate 3-epimerase [Clostridium sp.]MCI7443506.1 ribulose-phosphate 3-epimerase [Clostridium sp.]